MASYITATDINAVIDDGARQALFTPTGSSYDSGTFSTCVMHASEIVKAAALNAGYTLGDTTTNQTVKTATVGQFLALAFARKQQSLPEQFWAMFNMTEGIRTGNIPIPGATPSETAAIGGSKFSSTDTTVTGSRENLLDRESLKNF